MGDMAEYIAGLPKVELHVHHVGAASPAAVAQLAARHAGSTPVPADEAGLAEFFEFRDFAHFLDVYRSVVDLIRTPEDVHTLTEQVSRDLVAQNVRYAELTITPYMSVIRGIDAGAFCEAVEDVRTGVARQLGLELQWCFDVAGEEGIRGAEGTLQIVLDRQPGGLVSFGLGGAVQDPSLVAHLAEHAIPLEICVSSNVCTRSVPSLADHPLAELVAAGVPVSINSDDPPMFSTDLNREYAIAAELLGLDQGGVTDLARAALAQSFAPEHIRARIADEIDAYAVRC